MKSINDINELLASTYEMIDSGDLKFHGMSYEEGVRAALLWVIEESDVNPLED